LNRKNKGFQPITSKHRPSGGLFKV